MNAILLLGMPGGSEMLIVLFVVLLLFGGSRLPQLAKGLGESVKEFKKGAAQGRDGDVVELVAPRRLNLHAGGPNGGGAGKTTRTRYVAGGGR